MVRNLKNLAILSAMCAAMAASDAMAADVTDVLDAADEVYLGSEKVSDPFDISLTPKFVQRLEWAKLKREYNDQTNRDIRLLNELEYGRTINEFDVDLEVGMYHDLALRVHLPIIISDESTYKFDTTSDKEEFKIDPSKSTLAPTDGLGGDRTYKFFNLEAEQKLTSKKRSGIGDMGFGIAWSPYNTERHFIPERPWERNTGRSTITLAFDYFAPTGSTRGIDNTNVGSGTHELQFTVAASHRFPFVDPYIRLQYGLPLATDDYKEYGENQARVKPGMWGRIDLGIEFIPYESIDVKFQRNVKIDLRGYFKYNAEGRRYMELSDALATNEACMGISTDQLAAHPECGWMAEKWSNAGDQWQDLGNTKYNGILKEDGLYDYEGYAVVGGSLSLSIMPIQYVTIIAGVSADYEQDHFVTFTKIGKDRVTYNGENNIDPDHKDGVVTDTLVQERSPTFSGALDRVGQRIKRVESFNLEWFVGLKLQY